MLFILPAHTSHILQPMDVGCYDPFQCMYNAECYKCRHLPLSHVITYVNLLVKYKVQLCVLKTYSCVQKTGVCPFDRAVINKDNIKLSELLTLDKTADENLTDLGENVEEVNQQNEVESRTVEEQNEQQIKIL